MLEEEVLKRAFLEDQMTINIDDFSNSGFVTRLFDTGNSVEVNASTFSVLKYVNGTINEPVSNNAHPGGSRVILDYTGKSKSYVNNINYDNFNEKETAEGEKYAIVKPVDTGLSSENHYAINAGVDEGDIIVTGRYRVLSKELQHGRKVSFKIESNSY